MIGVALLGVSCGSGGSSSAPAGPAVSTAASSLPDPVIDPGDGGVYEPLIDPAAFVTVIDNPYLPITPGATWTYEGTVDGATERVVVVATGETREIMGVTVTVVRDTVTIDGELHEDTFDWFAQDVAGNVWYFGEDVKDYENGAVVSTAGSWTAGVGGALPGIVMPAQPKVGLAFRQEKWDGEAEDMAEVIEVGGSQTVASGTYADVIVTRDWNPLDPEPVEEKTYARGVGLIFETTTRGGTGTTELVARAPGP